MKRASVATCLTFTLLVALALFAGGCATTGGAAAGRNAPAEPLGTY